MPQLVLKQDIKDKVNENKILKGFIADDLGIGFTTLWRYLKDDERVLTSKSVLLLISKHLGIPEDDLLEVKLETEVPLQQ